MYVKVGPRDFVLQSLVPGGVAAAEQEDSSGAEDSSGLREFLLLHLIRTRLHRTKPQKKNDDDPSSKEQNRE
jgi:hypothetical protein